MLGIVTIHASFGALYITGKLAGAAGTVMDRPARATAEEPAGPAVSGATAPAWRQRPGDVKPEALRTRREAGGAMGDGGLEPPTSSLSEKRSNRLS